MGNREVVAYVIALVDLRSSPGGDQLCYESRRLCALLISMPDPRVESPIEFAKRIGTYGKIDRSKQYEGRYSNEVLLRNDNLQFKRLREMERLQLRNALVVLIVSAVLAHAPKIWAWLGSFTR